MHAACSVDHQNVDIPRDCSFAGIENDGGRIGALTMPDDVDNRGAPQSATA